MNEAQKDDERRAIVNALVQGDAVRCWDAINEKSDYLCLFCHPNDEGEHETTCLVTRARELFQQELPWQDRDDLAELEYDKELPPALVKSLSDQPWDYAMGLRDGHIIRFCGAEIVRNGLWVHLDRKDFDGCMLGYDFSFDRGLDVRIRDIAWVA